ncbi:MAG TPA: hypothetical protein VGH28_15640 [Polyangiaceae bacterium]|jgi:hypothetical protein
MSAPLEYTLGERASRALGPALIACGMVLWAVIPAWHAIESGATHVSRTGGPFPFRLYIGIALTIVGSLVVASAKPSERALDRFNHDGSVRRRGTGGRARVTAIHSKRKLFGPWVEVYATLDVEQPSYTTKTTVVLNEDSLRAFRPGKTVKVHIDPDDRDEIAVTL